MGHPDNTTSSPQLNAVRIAAAFAFSLALLKGLAFVQSGSVALLASLVDSMLDGLASLVNLVAIRYAMVPADDGHRFGHGKAEPLAALAQTAFITGSGLFVLLEALRRYTLDEPIAPQGISGIAVMLIAIVGTAALVLYQRRVARKTGSLVVEADALHYLSDMLSNVAVLAALVLASQPSFWWVDPVAAILVALYVLHSAYSVGRQALRQLMDHELPSDMRKAIADAACQEPGVLGIHDLKTRAAGPYRFVQLHLEVDGSLQLERAHAIGDRVAERVRGACPDAQVIIHQDPVNPADYPSSGAANSTMNSSSAASTP